jgi:alginate O-acetyltransferase complex protein AlgI
MLFSSAEFLFFFLLVFALHRILPWRRALLLVASYAFYSSWNPPFVLLLAYTTLIDYALGKSIAAETRPGRRRALLGLSLFGNLGVLACFKYVNFLLDTLVQAGAVAAETVVPFRVHAQIPLGISFYTFQSLSYTIDVYRGRIPACRSAVDFFLYVAFFPHLVAGPILRAEELLPQIADNRPAEAEGLLLGVELCLVGLFQKVVVADNLALLVDEVFARPHDYGGPALLVGALAFVGQIYCDFAGYSTMARGLASLLGYSLPENFHYPILAGDPITYRRRWHITMGRWFSDYVYKPLGGDRHGEARTAFNTLVTWTAFGFWHGAQWTFLLWGLYQGALIAGYRLLRARGWLPRPGLATSAVGYAVMPLVLCLSSVYFRSADVGTANAMLGRIFAWAPGASVAGAWLVLMFGLYIAHWAAYLTYREGVLVRTAWPGRLAWVGAAMAVLFLFAGAGEPFYYFQF